MFSVAFMDIKLIDIVAICVCNSKMVEIRLSDFVRMKSQSCTEPLLSLDILCSVKQRTFYRHPEIHNILNYW